jgi:pimeloyl-ACP methyl ester carboxylesterase
LLLIHGLLGYSFSWRFNIDELGKIRSVYAVDLPGTGFSERPKTLNCGMRASAERLWRFADAVGIGTADIVGTSHGGTLAMFMSAMKPDRVKKLVLVAPANPWSKIGRKRIWFLSGGVGRVALRTAGPALLGAGNTLFLKRMYADPERIRPGTLEGYSMPFRIPGAVDYGLEIVRCWRRDMQELTTLAHELSDRSMLLLWGDRDRVVDPGSATAMLEKFPKSKLAVLSNVGHLPYEEVPHEFNRVVAEYLAE